MNYIECDTEAQAVAVVAEFKSQGYRAYFLKNSINSFTVRYWAY